MSYLILLILLFQILLSGKVTCWCWFFKVDMWLVGNVTCRPNSANAQSQQHQWSINFTTTTWIYAGLKMQRQGGRRRLAMTWRGAAPKWCQMYHLGLGEYFLSFFVVFFILIDVLLCISRFYSTKHTTGREMEAGNNEKGPQMMPDMSFGRFFFFFFFLFSCFIEYI